jgi:hypothetical protein
MLLMIQDVDTVQLVDTQGFEDLRELGVWEHNMQWHCPQCGRPVWTVTLQRQPTLYEALSTAFTKF